MSRIRIYTVHTKLLSSPPQATDHDDEVVLVREGFSWPACVLAGLWACWHRMWRHAAFLFGVAAGLIVFFDWMAVPPAPRLAVLLGYFLLVGFQANDWRRGDLARRGFDLTAVVAAPDGDAAALRFLENRSETRESGSQGCGSPA